MAVKRGNRKSAPKRAPSGLEIKAGLWTRVVGDLRPPQGKGHFDRFFVTNGMLSAVVFHVEAHLIPAAGGPPMSIVRTMPIMPGEVGCIEIPGPTFESREAMIILFYFGGQATFHGLIPPGDGEYINSMAVGIGEFMREDAPVKFGYAAVYGHGDTLYPLGSPDIEVN